MPNCTIHLSSPSALSIGKWLTMLALDAFGRGEAANKMGDAPLVGYCVKGGEDLGGWVVQFGMSVLEMCKDQRV